MQLSKQTELLSGLGVFFAIWTITFIYSNLMQPIGYSQHYWFSTTALFIASGCILSSIIIKKPYVIAPGLSVGWFAATQILPQSNLVNFFLCIICSGIILIATSKIKNLKHIAQLLPNYLQATISMGIGCLFIRLALVEQLQFGTKILNHMLFISTIALMIYFQLRKNAAGSLITVVIILTLSLIFKVTHWHGVFALPEHFKTILSIETIKVNWHILPKQVLEMSLFTFFNIATGVFCLRQICLALNINTSDQLLSKACLASGINDVLAGFFVCGPNTVYIESAFGLHLGGRGRLSLIITCLCFLIFAFCFPLGQMIPQELFRGIFFFIGLTLLMPVKILHNQLRQEKLIAGILLAIIIYSRSILNGLYLGIIIHYLILLKQKHTIERINHLISLISLCSLFIKFI